MQEPNFTSRCHELARRVTLASVAVLCSSCVVNMPDAIDKSRRELRSQLSEADPAGHAALQRSWYGRLLRTLFEISGKEAKLRKNIGAADVRQIQDLLQEVADQVARTGGGLKRETDLLASLGLPSAGKRVSILVLQDDSNRVAITPECDRSRLVLSVQAVREIVSTALNQREVNELEALAEQWFFEMFHVQASDEESTLSGSPVATLFGPPRSKYVTKKLERQLGAQGTVVWKALAFVIGHEAHHLWSNGCVRDDDNAVQQQREARADVWGTMLAVTAYNRQCGRELVASKEDAQVMLSEKQTLPQVPREVALQMALVPSPELLVGASGLVAMQSALGPFFDADPSHADAGIRAKLDDRGATSLTRKLYGQPLKGSWMVSIIGRVAGATKDELIEYAYADLMFSPNYRLVESFIICTDIEFVERPKRPGVF